MKTIRVSDEEFADWVKQTIPGQQQPVKETAASGDSTDAPDESALPAYAGPGSTAVWFSDLQGKRQMSILLQQQKTV